RRQQLEPAKQRTLGHDVHSALAHNGHYLGEPHRRLDFNFEPAEPLAVEVDSKLQILIAHPSRDHVPPQADETNSIQLLRDALDGWPQPAADLSLTPPVLPPMHNIKALAAGPGRNPQ